MGAELSLLGEVVGLACDPAVDLGEFQSRVASSPDLCAEVVRAGNSPIYGMPGRIDRLERAVLILGPRTVASIATAVVVRHALGSARVGGLESEAIWLHSLETGVCARLLARPLDPGLEFEAYLTGLLHHLGTLDLLDEVNGANGALPHVLHDALNGACAEGVSRTLAALVRASHAVVRSPCGGWKDEAPDDARLVTDLGLLDDELLATRRGVSARVKELAALFA